MPTCFVIQPFDSGEFDRRFNEVYKPALQQADLEVYRVDEDPSAEILIEAIEKNISESDICFADITTDNPNVWYELGYAFALDLPVVIVCSESRERFPFDIQHRKIIKYSSGSPSDFETLKQQISETADALLTKENSLNRIANAGRIALTDGLDQQEILVLAVLASHTAIPDSLSSMYTLKTDAERSGLTAIGFALAFRKLIEKNHIVIVSIVDDFGEETDQLVQLTKLGWEWMSRNESLFSLLKVKPPEPDGKESG